MLEEFAAERYNQEAATALEALKGVECLIFDMDGVLVDVSQSYRTVNPEPPSHTDQCSCQMG